MGTLRKSFTKEFKMEAVRLLTEGRGSVAQVADDLGINTARPLEAGVGSEP